MNTTPTVSIIIPVYNAEQYLEECLDSVVNQTLKNIEIICVDDASTDSSVKILNQYADKDNRIRIIKYTVNKSASQARKDGVLSAKGEYIMFMDADDRLELSACESLVQDMYSYQVDILQFGTFVDALDTVKKSSVSAFARFVAPYTNYLYGRDIFRGCFEERKFRFNLWNKIYRASLCKKAFTYIEDGSFPKAQDLYAFFIISWFAQSYYGIKTKYYHYNYGRGITGGGKTLDLPAIERYCAQDKVSTKCKEFLISQKAWDEFEPLWIRLTKDLINECISAWLNYCDDSVASEGFDILIQHWGITAIQEAVTRNFKSQVDAIEKKSKNAASLHGIPLMNFWDPNEYVASTDAAVPSGFDHVVPVIFATNDNYSIYAGVAIESILKNASPQNYYRIYILYDELSASHITALEGISSKQATVKCVNVARLIRQKEVTLHERAYFTKEMYYRFLIPEIFKLYPYAIYLDCDLVVTTDIADILSFDFEDCLLGAVRNYVTPMTEKRLAKDFKIDPMQYVNSGVLVFNIAQWNHENTVNECFHRLGTIPKEKLVFCDQDILNLVCAGRIYFLDPSWNFCWHMIYGTKEFVQISKPTVEKIGNNYKILHFASNIKPWASPELPLSKVFWEYARISPFYEEILYKNISTALPIVTNNAGPSSNSQQNNHAISGPYSSDAAGMRIRQLERQLAIANQEIINIRKSWTYRIGRFITFVPRKIRGGIRCYKENGFYYTVERCLIHLHLYNFILKRKNSNKTAPSSTVSSEPVQRDYSFYEKLPIKQYPKELSLWYKKVTGNTLNLIHPRTFNEKIQWLKLYDSTPLKTRLADKYLVRAWVKEKIGDEYLIPILGVWDSFDEIDFDKLPNQFVLKANHGSGWNIVVKDKKKLNIKEAKQKFDNWMHKNFAFTWGLELHYMNIPPKIIAEKYMADLDGDIYDYRFFCFNGTPKYVWVDIGSGTSHHKRNIYDVNWNFQNYHVNYPQIVPAPEKPKTFDEMVRCATILCENFAFVRVDFYSVNDHVYFGEMTFTPQGGVGKWEDETQNRHYGDLIKLPPKSPIPERKVW